MSIRDDIVNIRRARISREGPAQGVVLPSQRGVPLVPFARSPFLVCEVKRRSPSKGEISLDLDAVNQVSQYVTRGAKSISVLTEVDHFCGSLQDLLDIKRRFPDISLLRKDFLLDVQDVEVSFLAGADAILLIASILDSQALAAMYQRAKQLGLAVLLEVHTESELAKARSLQADLLGINCRDLTTFAVDLAHPIWLKSKVDWNTRLVFESGITCAEDCLLALRSGFSGVLVGEAVVKNPELVDELVGAMASECSSECSHGSAHLQPRFHARRGSFWERLYARKQAGLPLVKICGITRADDAVCAQEAGADVLGFILAPSKRRASFTLLRELRGLDVLKAAVVVVDPERGQRFDKRVCEFQAEGLLDVIQFHGEEKPEECVAMAFPYYKAVRVGRREDLRRIGCYRSPRVLLDAFSPQQRGGTGMTIPEQLVSEAAEKLPLWLAGGIGVHNVGHVVRTFRPELIDASSRLESAPGIKDKNALKTYIQEIRRAVLQ